jgi:hypothetical protein
MRVQKFGRYGVYEPQETTDGPVKWTVHRIDESTEPEGDGEVIGEFPERRYAEIFAEAIYHSNKRVDLGRLYRTYGA